MGTLYFVGIGPSVNAIISLLIFFTVVVLYPDLTQHKIFVRNLLYVTCSTEIRRNLDCIHFVIIFLPEPLNICILISIHIFLNK